MALATYRGAPDEVARLGYAVAHFLDPAIPAVDKLSPETTALAQQIANALAAAKRPVVISGASCEGKSVIKASANITWALHKKNPNAGIVLTLPECNSMGLAMMGGHRLNSAFNAVLNGHADTVIIMENDLYRHGKMDVVDQFLQQCKKVIVFDHTPTATSQKAHVVVPSGTFAESDGILVNNEGRAQRFFQVFEHPEIIQESWRWLLQVGALTGHERLSQWKNYQDITHAIATGEPLLRDVEKVSPAADFRIAGQKIPREPHRYSGRTAMKANINVSEPKPPEDNDSPLSYTMEGFRGLPPSAVIPFFWSPGWNSVQSVNKYQEAIGESLRGGDPGVRLLEPRPNAQLSYFTVVPEVFAPLKDHLWTVPLYHIFGSEELSARGKAVSKRVPVNYIMINTADAAELNIKQGQPLSFEIDKQPYTLPVVLNSHLPKGVSGLPYGLPGLPFVELPAWSILKKS